MIAFDNLGYHKILKNRTTHGAVHQGITVTPFGQVCHQPAVIEIELWFGYHAFKHIVGIWVEIKHDVQVALNSLDGLDDVMEIIEQAFSQQED